MFSTYIVQIGSFVWYNVFGILVENLINETFEFATCALVVE